AADLVGDGGGDHLRGGGGEVHAATGVVPVQAVGDVVVLLEVVGQGEVQERPPGRGQLHAGGEPALHHRQVAGGQVLVEPVDIRVDLQPVGRWQRGRVDPGAGDHHHAQARDPPAGRGAGGGGAAAQGPAG